MRVRDALVVLLCAVGTAEAAAEKQTQYLAVFMGGKKIGYAVHTRQVEGKRVVNKQFVKMTIARMGQPIAVTTEETFVETIDGKPVSFRLVRRLGPLPERLEGTIESDGKVTVTRSGGRKEVLPWPAGAVMVEGARILARKKGLKEGTTYTYRLFSPSTMSAVENRVRVGPQRQVDLLGRVVSLTEIRSTVVVPTLLGPVQLQTTTYVNDRFEELKSVTPLLGQMTEMVACSRTFALSDNDVVDFFEKALVASPVPLPETCRSITYHLKAPGPEPLKIPAGDNQTVRPGPGGTVLVTVRPVSPPRGGRFPYRGDDAEVLSALKPTRFIQSDEQAVVSLASKAVGRTSDAAEAVRRIERFVRGYITRKDLSVGYASAAEVVASRQGDCSEHAVLVAALCRAVGIPARVVTGLMYVRRLGARKDVFGPHAWVEARVGDKWVGLDAAQAGYDARHIALTVGNGDPEDFLGLVKVLGRVRITHVRVER